MTIELERGGCEWIFLYFGNDKSTKHATKRNRIH